MKLRAIWLAATIFLFLGWLGWLAYLAATTAHPVILSRPQLLISTLDVLADVHDERGRPAEDVKVVLVHWPTQGSDQKLAGKTIHVTNLPHCAEKWIGAGRYILPLVKEGTAYRVAAIPRSPGYINPDLGTEESRIYPVTTQTLQQLDLIQKPAGQRR